MLSNWISIDSITEHFRVFCFVAISKGKANEELVTSLLMVKYNLMKGSGIISLLKCGEMQSIPGEHPQMISN